MFKSSEPKHDPVAAQLLSPSNCKSSTRIRAFLRLSRLATDDTIRQHLNEVSAQDCDTYFTTVIVPAWMERTRAIQYCSEYSTQLRSITNSLVVEGASGTASGVATAKTASDFDLRTDPYALRKYTEQLETQFAQCDQIDNWVANERNVEKIVRELTEEVLNQKCYYSEWLRRFEDASS